MILQVHLFAFNFVKFADVFFMHVVTKVTEMFDVHVCVFIGVDDQGCDSVNEERDVTSLPAVVVSHENKEAVVGVAMDDIERVDNAVASKGGEVNNFDDSTDGAVSNTITKDITDTLGNDAVVDTRDNSDTLGNGAVDNTRHEHSIEWSGCDGEYNQSDTKKMESRSHDALSVDVMLDEDAQIENCFNSPYGGE